MSDVLAGMTAATRLIDTMRATPRRSKEGSEPLRNTALYDQGCEKLFQWLISGDDVNPPEDRFPRSIASITLTQARLGDAGFRAIVTWLESLKSLDDIIPGNRFRFLNLGFNQIVGSADLARDFVSSVSFPSPRSSTPSSWLSQLILSNNPLSAPFKATLFSLLPTLPSLRHLGLTATGLTKDDGLALALYIRSETHSCKLTELHASENHMGYRGVRAIIVALERCWTMEKVEIDPNDIGEPPDDQENNEIQATKEGEGADGRLLGFEGLSRFARMPGFGTASFGGMHALGSAILYEALDKVLSRNVSSKPTVIKEALLLLKYSRLMLQKNLKLDLQPTQQELSTNAPENLTHSSFSFTYLPTEIQLSILSPLAPTLSHIQRIRVFEYAVDPSTLPSLQPPEERMTPKEWAASIGCDAFDPEVH